MKNILERSTVSPVDLSEQPDSSHLFLAKGPAFGEIVLACDRITVTPRSVEVWLGAESVGQFSPQTTAWSLLPRKYVDVLTQEERQRAMADDEKLKEQLGNELYPDLAEHAGLEKRLHETMLRSRMRQVERGENLEQAPGAGHYL